MSSQIIIVCDEKGNPTGEYIPKDVGHTGEGRRHIGVTVLLYNKAGQLLLQRRKHQNFDNIWCFTGDTHKLHTETGDESFEEATMRCLDFEWGIKDKIDLKNLGTFNYLEKVGSRCENENCAMMIGEYNGEIILNSETAYEYKWVEKSEFLKDFTENSKKYAPWVLGGVTILKEKGFFNE